MSEKRPGLIRRTLVGGWRLLDFTRRFILTVLFLIAVIWFIAAALRPGLQLSDRTALVIQPVGVLVEQYTMSPSDRIMASFTGDDVPEVQLRDLLRALDAAAADARIERVVLRLDRFAGGGLASLRDVAAGIDKVRGAGKEVIAFGDAYAQGGLFLASRADRVHLDPMGATLLEGFGRYRFYYADTLARLGVRAHLFRVGEYKSAGEPYIRSGASDEAREADLYWMGDLWQRFLGDIAQARKVSAQDLQRAIEDLPARLSQAGGDLARLSVDMGLVDQLTPWHELERDLIARGAADDDGTSFRQISLDDFLTVIDRERGPITSAAPVAIVVAQGEIVPGSPGRSMLGGEAVSELLRQAREDDDVKAVVLRVDSPGGQVFPSEQIRRESMLLRQAGKKVVISMGDVAASGGYLISTDADRIVADPSTITGSIGVFGLWMDASEGVGKLGLGTDGVATTWIPGAFDPTRPFDERLGQVMQTSVDKVYEDFISQVAQARNTTPEVIDVVARGRVWSGAQALERGLVDSLGGLEQAIAQARELAGLPADAGFAYIEQPPTFMDRLLGGFGGSAMASFGVRHGLLMPSAWLPKHAVDDLTRMQRMLNSRSPGQQSVYMHCECGTGQ